MLILDGIYLDFSQERNPGVWEEWEESKEIFPLTLPTLPTLPTPIREKFGFSSFAFLHQAGGVFCNAH
ncbi:hypothetical protein [Nostoc sp. FACHB-280]|uniref:hypothetical protein n=1 Tax=Nostoc sp. FACHB-280 TaxID=2692839 RepID=UPI00168ACCC7|nr:hypothetical protein [Nostoc sp. FACHB-280]MBD2496021.1 hypothetical protein [Nostoc sp. FACHB-280]